MIITEEQECFLNCLHKYQQWLYKFYNYNNVSRWLEKETEINKAIESVRTGKYIDNMSMCDYINACVVCVEEVERGLHQDESIISSKRADLERRRNKKLAEDILDIDIIDQTSSKIRDKAKKILELLEE